MEIQLDAKLEPVAAALAEAQGISLAELIARAVQQYCERHAVPAQLDSPAG